MLAPLKMEKIWLEHPKVAEMGFRRFIKRKERRQKSNGGKKKVDFNGEFYDSKILKLFRGKIISTGAVYMY